MPEAKSRFLEKIIGTDVAADEPKAFTSERQHSAQAFTLHVEWRDGRRSEGFAWAHYAGYQWLDSGAVERVLLIFGHRALEIEGHNLGILIADIRDGQLNSIREMTTGQQLSLRNSNPEGQPVISAVRSYPEIDKIMKEIKGEDDDQAGYARRVQRG